MLYSILKVNKIISYNSDEEIKLDLDQCIRHYTFTKIYIENFHFTCIILDLPAELKEIKKIREQMQREHFWHNRKQYRTANHINYTCK